MIRTLASTKRRVVDLFLLERKQSKNHNIYHRYISSTVCFRTNISNDAIEEMQKSNDSQEKIFNSVLWQKQPKVSFSIKSKQKKAKHFLEVKSDGVLKSRPITMRFLDENQDAHPPQNEMIETLKEDDPTYPYAGKKKKGFYEHQ